MARTGPILIVDDEAGIRQSLEGVLTDEGYSCVHAKDGADALSQLRTARPVAGASRHLDAGHGRHRDASADQGARCPAFPSS